MSKLLAECTKREDGAELSFLTLVSPATIEAYFDGDTVNQRADGHEQRVQYLAEPIIRCCMKIGKYLDPNFDTSGHDILLARAQKESKNRASQDAPLYKHFVTTALREGGYVYANDPDWSKLCKVVFLLLQVAMVPSRERTFLFTTFADLQHFDAKKDHSRAILDAKRAEYDSRTDIALATVVFGRRSHCRQLRTCTDHDLRHRHLYCLLSVAFITTPAE